MPEPNFSESQLQNAVNSACARAVFDEYGKWVMARVPSLFAEFDLGWDSGFHFPWLPYVPSTDDKGCNFFLQYKLSLALQTSSAKEWQHWKSPYLRFKIPHSRWDPNTRKVADDYHQWDRLKALASRGYPVFYITNWTMEENDLDAAFQDGTLLDSVPSLDVRAVQARHRHVTFTEASTHFLLHSEPENAQRLSLRQALVGLGGEEMVPVRHATQALVRSVREVMAEGNQRVLEGLRIVESAKIDQAFPEEVRPWLQRARLSALLRRHYAVELHWRPESYTSRRQAD